VTLGFQVGTTVARREEREGKGSHFGRGMTSQNGVGAKTSADSLGNKQNKNKSEVWLKT
jgi:hypothetical protein